MSTYRNELPQLTAGLFLADGGLETTLVFDDGIDLPDFAAFPLLETEEGRAALVRYYDAYLAVADRDGVGSRSTRRPGGRRPTGPPGSGTRPTAWSSCTGPRSGCCSSGGPRGSAPACPS